MNQGILVTLLFFLSLATASSQNKNDYSIPDDIARSTPDSVERSVLLLSDYFRANLTTQRDLVRAFYSWTANEIEYDVENMYNIRPVTNSGLLILEVLETRKAVCQGYAEVFHELCKNAGIESYLIQGYTKQNGVVMNLSHTWILAVIDSSWYFFDPTWGSGYLLNGKFTHKFMEEYFMVSPSAIVKSHMPFDPMWQCLNNPYTSSDFYNGQAPKPGTSGDFVYADSIRAYLNLSKAGQYAAALRRVEANGVVNNNIGEYTRYLRQNLEIERMNKENNLRNDLATRFNDAVNNFNTASLRFNDYINYFNKQFKPAKPDAEIRQMLDTCITSLELSRGKLAKIEPREESLQNNKQMLSKAMEDLQQKIDEQDAFLRKYFATAKAFRPALFRR
jgi:hypothetical protein